MCTLEKLNFKISRGSMPPDPPSILASSALDTIWAGITLNCFRRAGYFQSALLTMILRILRIQNDVSFLSRKGWTSRIVQRYIYFKDCRHEVRSSLKCTPHRKSCVRACNAYDLFLFCYHDRVRPLYLILLMLTICSYSVITTGFVLCISSS